MRIAYCIPGLGPSGGVRVILEHCQRLHQRGHDVVIFSSNLGGTAWFGELSVPTYSRAHVDQHGWFDVAVATGHDTVYWVDTLPAGRLFWFVQMAEQLFHPVDSQRYEEDLRAYNLALGLGIRPITIASWLAKALAGHGFENVPVVPNGVNLKHFHKVERRGNHIVLEGDARNPAKDVDSIAWRVGRVLRGQFGVKLCGMAATVPAWGRLLDSFIFRPSLSDFRKMYSGALFLLKASRWEGRSLSPLEAMACETTTCRGIIKGDDDLVDRLNCLRRDYDYQAVLGAAKMLCSDKGLLKKLSVGATAYAKEHLRWEPIIDRLEGLYGQA